MVEISTAGGATQTNPKHILIVEDSIDFRTLLDRLFTKKGYRVGSAGHGGEALEQLQRDQTASLPDLILLDLMMPVMDGFEFREKQMQDKNLSDIPVILMTAHGNLANEASRLDIKNCIRKPVDMKELLHLVEGIIPRTESGSSPASN